MSVHFDSGGGWQYIGEGVSMSFRHVHEDGTQTTPAGACPHCCTVPMNGEPHICEHGVTLGNAVHGPRITRVDGPRS